MGDLLGGLRGWAVNMMLRHVRRTVPPFNLPGAVRFAEVMRQGKDLPFEPPQLGGEGSGLFAVHGRDDWRVAGSDVDAPQHGGECVAELCVVPSGDGSAGKADAGRVAGVRGGVAALSHLCADDLSAGELQLGAR